MNTDKEQKLEWPKTAGTSAVSSSLDHAWHVAINKVALPSAKNGWPRFMYDAKHAAHEVPRLALLFRMEREGKLAKTFRRCSCCSEQKHVVDNHLTCCLGTKCRECPFLAGLELAELSAEEKDWIKAWTCVGHILSEGGDVAGEGFILTVDDRMFWDSVHESLAMGMGQQEEEDGNR